MLRFLTAGESHGPAEVTILEGIPAGLPLTKEDIQVELDKRRSGSGRGGRGVIETDQVEILSGVRLGKTIGSPITVIVKNLDHKNWQELMSIELQSSGVKPIHFPGVLASHLRKITNPRPGHADLAGVLKYGFADVRNVLERASARETIMRVAVGAICKKFLKEFSIGITSRIIQIGKCRNVNSQMEKIIEQARIKKDTLGGVIEITAHHVPPGLGSFIQYDRRLDGRLAQVLMSIPSVKAVEIGEGIDSAGKFGSKVHDEIFMDNNRFVRKTNRAGGIEGGVSNGEDIVCRVFHKPLSTLGNPLKTIDTQTKKETTAAIERSDICAVPRAGVISEAAVAFTLADAMMEKFGGDSMREIKRNFTGFMNDLNNL